MSEFKTVLSDPKAGKSYQLVLTGQNYRSFIGKKIGDEIDGVFVSLPGYKLMITGGSDINGFPMRKDLPGGNKRKHLISKSTGFKPKIGGQRIKKSMRGNTISTEIVQINMKIIKHGSKGIEDLLAQEGDKK